MSLLKKTKYWYGGNFRDQNLKKLPNSYQKTILFGVHQRNLSYTNSFYESKKIYQERIDNIVNKHMFVTAFGQSLANELYEKELEKIECLEQML